MLKPKQEIKILKQLEKIYLDPDKLANANRAKMRISVFWGGFALPFLGIFLSGFEVIWGLCDLLLCFSGLCFGLSGLYYSMLLTNPLVRQFTSLNEGNLSRRVELLRNGNDQERGRSFRGIEPSFGIADDWRKVFLDLD